MKIITTTVSLDTYEDVRNKTANVKETNQESNDEEIYAKKLANAVVSCYKNAHDTEGIHGIFTVNLIGEEAIQQKDSE